MYCTTRLMNPSRGRARRDDEDGIEKDEKIDGLAALVRPPPVIPDPKLKIDGAEWRGWWVVV